MLIVGCSHSGVENIILEDKNFTKNNIALVYGGFHLLPFGREQLEQLGHVLKDELGVAKVAPAHCTGHLAFRMLKNLYGDNYLFAGLGETISFIKKVMPVILANNFTNGLIGIEVDADGNL